MFMPVFIIPLYIIVLMVMSMSEKLHEVARKVSGYVDLIKIARETGTDYSRVRDLAITELASAIDSGIKIDDLYYAQLEQALITGIVDRANEPYPEAKDNARTDRH